MLRNLAKFFLLGLSNTFRHNHDSKIIYYHDVGVKYTEMGTELDVISKQFEIVKEYGYEFVDLITQKEGQVMVCFDDGWAGIYDAKEFFISNGVFPTVFIVVDFIGLPGYLTLEQITELQGLGFCFQGHTWSHKDLTTLDDYELKHEIMDSKIELSRLFNKAIDSICFPKGRFSDLVYRICEEAGYEHLYSSISGGYYDLLASRHLICRNLVQSVSEKEFRFILNSSSHFFARRNMRQHYER